MENSDKSKKNNGLVIILAIALIILITTNIFTVIQLMQSRESLAEIRVKYELAEKNTKELKKENELLQKDINSLNERLTQLQSDSVSYEQSEEPQEKESPTYEVSEEPQKNVQPKAQDDSPNSFTVGSSQEHVKKIMGSPDSVVLDSWWYGKQSWVRFDGNGLVKSWYDGGNILKTN